MTIKDLKFYIENNSDINKLIIFKIADIDFIPIQYIKEIAKYMKKSIKYIDSVNGLSNINIFDDVSNIFYVYRTDNFDIKDDSLKSIDNLFIICKKVCNNNYKDYIIDVPKLEDWQIKDFAYSLADGVDQANLDTLVNSCKNNIYRLEYEIKKLSIFSKDERKYLYEQFVQDDVFSSLNEYNIFTFTNAILHRDIETLFKLYKNLETTGLDPMALVNILYSNFKKLIDVQLSKGLSPQQLGLTSSQYWAIKHQSCGYYTKDELVNIYRLLADIDRQLKTGYISSENIIDYLLVKIL